MKLITLSDFLSGFFVVGMTILLMPCWSAWAENLSFNVVTPIPENADTVPGKVSLGEKLFHEVRLSESEQKSCASCHVLTQGGDSELSNTSGEHAQSTSINVPTLFNAVFNFRQFWDGRAHTLAHQIDHVVASTTEFDTSWEKVVARLKQDKDYQIEFNQHYPEGITEENIRDALVEFEKSLTTPNSRFDQYLNGQLNALTSEERAGFALFRSRGCISCHHGINIGGNMFQKMGVFADYFVDRGKVTQADYGRYNVTQKEQDKFVFKVPSLRNVALTAPYFHDGSASNLNTAISQMAKYQLGTEFSDKECEQIEKFLNSLTGRSKWWD